MKAFKSGFVTIIGLPNAGKSTLLNTLIKEEVSIVTSKPQTTRKRTLGFLAKDDEYQVVFVDTPGFVETENGINLFLKKELERAVQDIHLIVACVAPWEFKSSEKPWALKLTENFKTPVIYISTQADIKLPDMAKWASFTNAPLLLTSGKTGEGLEELIEKILKILPEGEPYYDMDIYTNQTMRELSSELVRKHCFDKLHQEVPYGLAVNLRDFKEEKILKITADIVLARENHKGMVIGQKGQMLKAIGSGARQEMEKVFGQPVFLQLHVVVKPQWMKDGEWMKELGYAAE